MPVYTVHVGVALTRPPRTDALVRVLVEAATDPEAHCLAAQIAHCHPFVVMPVSTEIVALEL